MKANRFRPSSLISADKGAGAFVRRLLRPAVIRAKPSLPAAPAPSPDLSDVLLAWDEPHPVTRPVLAGIVQISGWALAPEGIDQVHVYIDGGPLGQARYGDPRPDTAHDHPTFAQAGHSGFLLRWCSVGVPDGTHELELQVVTNDGRVRTRKRTFVVDNVGFQKQQYDTWKEMFERRDIAEATLLSAGPLLTLVLPLQVIDPQLVVQSLRSLHIQTYPHWEATVMADPGTLDHVRSALPADLCSDPRIRAFPVSRSSLAERFNAGLAASDGEFLALLGGEDELPPHALYQVAKVLAEHPDAQVLYSDEDQIDASGTRSTPFFKPDWSPDLLLSFNYLGGLTFLRAGLVRELGGMHTGSEGGVYYDLLLRATSRVASVQHIPKVLYHRRTPPSLPAQEPSAGERLALDRHLKCQGVHAEVAPGCRPGRWRVRYAYPGSPDVAVILPTGGNIPLLDQCLRGLKEKTAYRYFEVLLIDNSRGDDVHALCEAYHLSGVRVRYLDRRGAAFNFSALNNFAARTTDAPLLLFLNDDTFPVHDGWLEAMVEHALRPEVGAVGAKLLFADGSLQHAGVAMGVTIIANHVFAEFPGDGETVLAFDLPYVIRNCSAVTAACMMTRADVFWEVGGFEEVHLAVAFQDLDLCLKIGARGYRVIYTPHAALHHYEGKTKEEKIPNPYEMRYVQRRWAQVIAHDPFYNPNLTRLHRDGSLALPF
jgi:GT2 family glycosyltransferase